MIKRYVRFEVKGMGEGVRAEERGLCDARLDPLQVAIRRNGKLALCDRFTITKSPAFNVAVDGNRHKGKKDVEITKFMREALGLDMPEGRSKERMFGFDRRRHTRKDKTRGRHRG